MNSRTLTELSDTLMHEGTNYKYWSLRKLEERFGLNLSRTPYTAKLLMEAMMRAFEAGTLQADHFEQIIRHLYEGKKGVLVPYLPARVILQDFTGVPVIADLAAMRDAVHLAGEDPRRVTPVVPTDVIVDHSIRVEASGCAEALTINTNLEYRENKERFTLLKWGERVLPNLRVFPPGIGIIHQLNLEYLSPVIHIKQQGNAYFLHPDSVCGTDSHTTMINGLGVLGWGGGGIEAESVMLGHPLFILSPAITGVHLHGRLKPGVTTTDLVLTLTERLRAENVVDEFVEFFGEGVSSLSLTERSTLANMSPEYGSTCAYFPVDDETIKYMRVTGRKESHIGLIEKYYKNQGLYGEMNQAPNYHRIITIDLASVVPCLAGPFKPENRIPLHDLRLSFHQTLQQLLPDMTSAENECTLAIQEKERSLAHGSILLAAITSCTNTSNPSVMVAAGLVAKNAVDKGLSVPYYVKRSLSPGSKVVTAYLEQAGLMEFLERLGFHVVGYGCMTCSGSSGPIENDIASEIIEKNLVTASILSGNRNFEGRIHPLIRANYLASPPLVIAYAIAGTVNIDITREPLGVDKNGHLVFLEDIWPTDKEIEDIVDSAIQPDMFLKNYHSFTLQNPNWESIEASAEELYSWDEESTYLKRAPYFERQHEGGGPLYGARVLAMLGDSITTDHISPGGVIHTDNPAGRYLLQKGVLPSDFNVFGSRRGNHEVMVRGTFSNNRLKNELIPGYEGGFTKHHPSEEILSIYEAAMRYHTEGTPLIVLAGKNYGCGSSRDWAAKGPKLLGVQAVIAQSFERIHRSNLIYMGVLPLTFIGNESWLSHGLKGNELYYVTGLEQLEVGKELIVKAEQEDGTYTMFTVRANIETSAELEYYLSGGILAYVMKSLLSKKDD